MKKDILKRVIAMLTLIVSVSSCNDYLDVEPYSDWNVDTFYSNEDEVDIAFAGIYSLLASDRVYGQALSVIMEAGTDEAYYNRRNDENWTVGLYRHTAADNFVANLWLNLYSCINLTNLLQEKLNRSVFEEEKANQYLAEARFMRAFAYFTLTNWYGDVPLNLAYVKDQTNNHIAASPIKEVYTQIVNDLTFATEHLLRANEGVYTPGRANRMAAHGLLARVYLKMSGFPLLENHYEDVMAQCDSIFADGFHDLNQTAGDGYRAHFLNYIENTYDTRESLFEISFAYLREKGLTTDGRIGGLNGVSFTYGGGQEGYPAAYAMVNASPLVDYLYDPLDKRLAWNVANYHYTTAGDLKRVSNALTIQHCPAKFRRWEPLDWADLDAIPPSGVMESYRVLETAIPLNKNFTSINFPVLRFSDVLLMYAEASNELVGVPTTLGIEYLNRVRNRAGLANIEDVAPAVITDHDLFFGEIVDERLREFCFEGLRKQDLIRWELLDEQLAKNEVAILGHPDYRASNETHNSFLRAGKNFDINRHLTLPYPLQEVTINNLLNQKTGW